MSDLGFQVLIISLFLCNFAKQNCSCPMKKKSMIDLHRIDVDEFKKVVNISDEAYNYYLENLLSFNGNKELVLTSHYLKFLLFYFEEPSLNDIFQSPKCRLYKNDVFPKK